ncbi:hypothetical protein [Methylophilus aquaticus]|uniref:EamA domain-containing protein n=1 Tax=Methylophilus aquaticus TaxID=1971610 RepID=A0ABT9JP71_9PROT|nr:hypothetical protein [Methylophilus aquaticus]MDP8566373.1 hypothetical protein [Methylophilus aquaticus]
MRWQVGMAGGLPEDTLGKLNFVCSLLIKPWVVTAMIASFLAGIAWMMTLTKFEISYAFPWTAINFVLVFLFAAFWFDEAMSLYKIFGITLIVSGILVLAKSGA